MPAAGEIVTAYEVWEEVGGGGAVAAAQLAKLNGSCTFYALLGDDELGRRSYEELAALGIKVEAEFVARPTRRAFTHVDDHGERTITVLGDKLHPSTSHRLPWIELAPLVGSGKDEAERYQPGELDPPPRLVVFTAGALGGWTQPGGPFNAAPLPAPISDAY